VNNLRSTLAIVWRIAIPYFRSEDKWAGRGLLATVIIIQLLQVAIDVLVNAWRNRFYNALQQYDWDSFVRELLIFCALAGVSVVLAVYGLYLNQWLQIRWRRWLTNDYLGRWLNGANHYRMQLKSEAIDNPDQRIAEDVRNFIELTLVIGIGLLSAVVTLASFVVILWGLSEAAPLRLFGNEVSIPGYLVWGALIYAVIGTALTQWIGAPLVNLDFQRERFEADFRFNLVRVRENAEQIALLKGEPSERERLAARFGNVITNWYAIMSRTKRLIGFTASFDQAAVIVPHILIAPAYFAHTIALGGMQQTADAFGSVQGALSYFVTVYRTMAEWPPSWHVSTASRHRSRARKPWRAHRARSISPARTSAMASISRSFSSTCRTARRWCRRRISVSRLTQTPSSPGPPAPASRHCSAPSPASGRSAAARSPFPPTRR